MEVQSTPPNIGILGRRPMQRPYVVYGAVKTPVAGEGKGTASSGLSGLAEVYDEHTASTGHQGDQRVDNTVPHPASASFSFLPRLGKPCAGEDRDTRDIPVCRLEAVAAVAAVTGG